MSNVVPSPTPFGCDHVVGVTRCEYAIGHLGRHSNEERAEPVAVLSPSFTAEEVKEICEALLLYSSPELKNRVLQTLRQAEAEPVAVPSLVAGDHMDRSIADFVRACEVHLAEEQARANPNNALIAVLCDAVRLAREQKAPLLDVAPAVAVPSPAPTQNYYGKSLQVEVRDGQLLISIGVDVLAGAAVYADWANPYDEDKHDYIRTFAITDAAAFAKDVLRAMQDEREDGSSPLSDFLDKVSEAALDAGSEAAEYDQRIKHGETSPLETWSTR